MPELWVEARLKAAEVHAMHRAANDLRQRPHRPLALGCRAACHHETHQNKVCT